MTKFAKLVVVICFLVISFTAFAENVSAGDGVTFIKSTTTVDQGCSAASLLMTDGSYPILVGCRGIIYPIKGPEDIFFYYILWTSPSDGSNPVRLGELGRGRATYRTNKAFDRLFVSVEERKEPRTPEGKIVMQGKLISYTELDRQFSPTPTSADKEAQITPSPPQSASSKLIKNLRNAGIVAALGIVTLIILVFVITRPR